MPKQKTHKATAKRIKRTKKGNLLRQTPGQDHFNARETGKARMNKRRDQSLAK
ncbi:MAG: 50S ribosomal protein L35 [Patescibacteria group bacterium]